MESRYDEFKSIYVRFVVENTEQAVLFIACREKTKKHRDRFCPVLFEIQMCNLQTYHNHVRMFCHSARTASFAETGQPGRAFSSIVVLYGSGRGLQVEQETSLAGV